MLFVRRGCLATRLTIPTSRYFFNIPGLERGSDGLSHGSVAHYKESKVLPYSQKQMYNVVQDVRSYPEFLPYCIDAVVSSSRSLPNLDRLMLATLTVGISPFKVSYESKVTCRPYEFVKAEASDSSSPFSHLETIWKFRPAQSEQTGVQNTLVSIDLSYALKDSVQSKFLDGIFSVLSKAMIEAFEERCQSKYVARQ